MCIHGRAWPRDLCPECMRLDGELERSGNVDCEIPHFLRRLPKPKKPPEQSQ
jgi:hypothetical protein